MADLTAQIAIEADASGVETGVGRAKRSLSDLGKAAGDTGRQVGDGLKPVGPTSEKVSKDLDRNTTAMVRSIQRQIAAAEAGGRGTAAYYREIANQRGLKLDVLEPYLRQLDDVAAKQRGSGAEMAAFEARARSMGMSVGELKAATRGLPAQFTDIAVSLQGGQAPMTVLLQQGGQLKDMFGGIGPAARGMGGYILGLVNPFTLAAAAAIGLYAAYRSGASETEAFERTLIKTGNTAGVTSSQLQAMAARIDNGVGTQREASRALNEFVQAGTVARANLEQFTAAAIAWEQATGEAVEHTVERFKELGKDPLKASLELNESMNYLTASVYQQIRALEEQGKQTQAAQLAQDAYARAIKDRAPQIVATLGTVERAWQRIKQAAGEAMDAVLSIGRTQSLTERLVEKERELVQLMDGAYERGASRRVAQVEAKRQEIAALQEEISLVEGRSLLERQANEERAAALKLARERADYVHDGRSDAQRRDDEIRLEREKWQGLVQDLDKGSKEYRDLLEAHNTRVKEINEKYKDKGAAGGITGGTANEQANIRGRIQDAKDEAQALELAYQAMLQGSTASAKLADSQKALNQVNEKLKATTDAGTRSRLQALKAEIEQWAAQEKATEALRARNKVQEEFEKERQRAIDAQIRETASITDKAIALEDEIAVYGLGKAAVEAMVIARLESKRAALIEMEASDDVIEALNREIAARERLAKATAQKEALDANKKAAEEAARDWERVTDQVGQSLTDAIFNGGKSGKQLVEDMFRTMVLRPLLQPVVSQGVDAVGQLLGIPGAGGSAGVGIGDMVSLANNAGKVWSGISSALGFGGAAAAGIGTASAAAGLGITGSMLGTGAGTSVGIGLGLNGAAAGLGLQAGGAALGGVAGTSAAATGAAAAGTGAGIMGTIGAAAPYAALAFAAYSLLSGSFKGETRNGGQYGYTADGLLVNNRRGTTTDMGGSGTYFLEGPSGGTGDDSQVRAAIDSTVGTINSILQGVGSQARLEGFWGGWETSEKGRGGVMAGGMLSDGTVFGESGAGSNYKGTLFEAHTTRSPDAETAVRNFVEDLYQSTIQALQAKSEDLPQTIRNMVEGVDAESLSSEAAQALVEQISRTVAEVNQLSAVLEQMPFGYLRDLSFDAKAAILQFAGGIEGLLAGQSTYYEHFYSQQEQLDNLSRDLSSALREVNVALPTTNAEYRAIVESLDLNTEAGQRAYAVMMGLSGSFNELTTGMAQMAQAAEQAADAQRQAAQKALDTAQQAAYDAAVAARQAAERSATDAMAILTNAVNRQKSALQEAYDEVAEALNAAIGTSQSALGNLQSLANRLQSTLNTMRGQADAAMNRAAAQAQLERALAVAQLTGMMPSGQAFENALQVVAQPSEGLFGSFEEYQLDFLKTAHDISLLNELTGEQISVEEQTLQMLKDQLAFETSQFEQQMAYYDQVLETAQAQLEEAMGTKLAVMSVEGAIANLASALANLKATSVPSTPSEAGKGGYINDIYRDLFGRDAEQAGIDYWTGRVESGLSVSDLERAIREAARNEDKSKVLRGFAVGGYATPGWALVGEEGPELVNFTNPGRVYTADQTREMLSMPNWSAPRADNAALEREVRALREEVSKLREYAYQTTKNTGRTARNTEAFDRASNDETVILAV